MIRVILKIQCLFLEINWIIFFFGDKFWENLEILVDKETSLVVSELSGEIKIQRQLL